MSTIVLAWELGAGYGHLGRLLPVAAALVRRGHRPIFIVRDLFRAQTVLGGRGFTILQAPVWLGPTPDDLDRVPSYAGTLLQQGYHRSVALAGLLSAWRRLLAWLQPDLVLIDHAPTAALAARSLGLTAALIGVGYGSPPRTTPLPAFDSRLGVSAERLLAAEANILQVINATLEPLGAAPLGRLAELLDMAEDFLCSFAELDHFGPRADRHYWGPLETSFGTGRPTWPAGEGSRVFAFLDAGYAGFAALAAALRRLGLPTLAYARDLPSARAAELGGASLQFTDQPVDLAWALGQCDLAVSAASHGATAAALLAGRPLLLLPHQGEQAMIARRVAALGASLAIDVAAEPKADFAAPIRRLVDEPEFAARARQFAADHAAFDAAAAAEAVAARCEELARDKPAPIHLSYRFTLS
jgi:UDP:flavonoid glycosyltransferase YjiC (YdhE family)